MTPSPPEGWQWDETLYLGSAPYYVRGRPPYAPGLADALRRILALDGQGRLLDVGCGPGVVTLPLAPLFTEAVGLDPDPGMLAEGARRAAEAGVGNIVWVRARGEDLPAGLGIVPRGDLCPVLPLDGPRPRGGDRLRDARARWRPGSHQRRQGRRGTGSLRRRAPSPVAAICGDPRADSTLSRPGAARRAGLPAIWQSGWRSDRPAQRRVPAARARAGTGRQACRSETRTTSSPGSIPSPARRRTCLAIVSTSSRADLRSSAR